VEALAADTQGVGGALVGAGAVVSSESAKLWSRSLGIVPPRRWSCGIPMDAHYA
jgi:glycerate-2-kinase